METMNPAHLREMLAYYKALGFERLPLEGIRPDRACEAEEAPARVVAAGAMAAPADKAGALKALREEIGDCTRCPLSQGRTKIAFGEGNPEARIMFVGEAPGREEDLQGRPFVGDAGQLLTKLIEKMGFRREDVYIANIVKCRPPQNRDPQETEIATCSPFLYRQIEIVSPRVIVSLGRIAGHTLSARRGPITGYAITRERGRFFTITTAGKEFIVMPTFHPAYLLRNPKDKWLTWEDAQAVLAKLGECDKE